MILCCYAEWNENAWRNMPVLAPDAVYTFTDPGDDLSYWPPVKRAWDGPGDLVLIEQGIEIHDGVLPAFTACPEPWCAFRYPIIQPGQWNDYGGPGCVRFRRELRDVVTVSVMEDALYSALPGTSWRDRHVWYRVESLILEGCRSQGLKPCVHEPPVMNHHPGQGHCGCC